MRGVGASVANAVVVEDEAVLHIVAHVEGLEVGIVPVLDAGGGRERAEEGEALLDSEALIQECLDGVEIVRV